ncbi:DEAD/DEAH box helicase [Megalodesulfovibrio paquesii]
MLPDLATLVTTIKTGVFEKKAAWRRIPLGEVPDFARRIPHADWTTGRVNIYLRASFETPAGVAYWPCLDVEASSEHDNVAANLAAAFETALAFEQAGLWSHETQVLLTGRGLRFIWPCLIRPEHGELYQHFLKDRVRWPCIDAGPNRKGTPLRLAGYRGHLKQGTPLKRRIHMLADPWQLFELDEVEYLRLVDGPGSPDEHCAIVEAILPRTWARVEHSWSRFLESYRRQVALASSLVEVVLPRPEKTRRALLAAVLAHVEEDLGMTPRVVDCGGRVIYQLPTCPLCGRDGKAWITGSGRIKCWRATCEASASEGGVSPSKWIEDFAPELPDLPEPASALTHGQALPLEEARALLRQAFEGQGNVLINATPGLGKTHAALDYLQAFCANGGRAVYAAPTHALAEEVADKARLRGIDTARVKGMHADICGPQWADAQSFIQRGFSPVAMYCRRKCPQREGCSYLQQSESAPLIVTSHACLPTREWSADLFVIDESAAASLLESQAVPWPAMETIASRLPSDSANVIRAVEDCCREALARLQATDKQHVHARLYASRPPEGHERACSLWEVLCVPDVALTALQRDLAAFEQGAEENWLRWQWRLWTEGLNLRAMRWLEEALSAKADLAAPGSVYLHVARSKTEPFHMVRVVNHAASLGQERRLILLDGTGDHAEAEGLWLRPIQPMRIKAAMPDLKTVWLRRGLGKGRTLQLSPRQLESRLQDCIKHLPPVASGAHDVLLLMHLAREGEALATAQDLDPSRNWSGLHHFGPRGVNSWEDCQAVIVLGTPTASPAGSLDAACTLFPTQEARLHWIASLGRRDLAQGIHRIRPIRGGKTIVVMGSHWPENFPPPGLILDGRRKAGTFPEALRRLRAFVDTHGFITQEIAALLGIGCGPDGQELLNRATSLLKAHKNDKNEGQGKVRDVESKLSGNHCTLIDYIIRVQKFSNDLDSTSSDVPGKTREGILLPDCAAWSNLLTALHQETGLPALEHHPIGRTRPQACLGHLDAAEAFYRAVGTHWSPDHWQGQPRSSTPIDISALKGVGTCRPHATQAEDW